MNSRKSELYNYARLCETNIPEIKFAEFGSHFHELTNKFRQPLERTSSIAPTTPTNRTQFQQLIQQFRLLLVALSEISGVRLIDSGTSNSIQVNLGVLCRASLSLATKV